MKKTLFTLSICFTATMAHPTMTKNTTEQTNLKKMKNPIAFSSRVARASRVNIESHMTRENRKVRTIRVSREIRTFRTSRSSQESRVARTFYDEYPKKVVLAKLK